MPITAKTKVFLISIILLAGFWISFAHLYVNAFYKNQSYPRNTFLFIPDDRFPGCPPIHGTHCYGDFTGTILQNRSQNPYKPEGVYRSNYLPLAHLLTAPFNYLPIEIATAVFLAFSATSWALCVFLALSGLDFLDRTLGTLAIGGFGYPFLVCLDRGNLEIFVAIGLFGFWHLYKTNRLVLAALFLGIISTFKPFPALLGVLFLRRRQWKLSLISFFSGVAALFIGLSTISSEPIFSTFADLVYAMNGFLDAVGGRAATDHHVSLHSFFSKIADYQSKADPGLNLNWFAHTAWPSIAPIFLAVSVILTIVLPLKEWRVVAVLILAGMIFQPGAGGYRPLSLIVFFGDWLRRNNNQQRRFDMLDTIFLTTFVTIWIPKVGGNWEVIITPPALTVMLIALLFLRDGLPIERGSPP